MYVIRHEGQGMSLVRSNSNTILRAMLSFESQTLLEDNHRKHNI